MSSRLALDKRWLLPPRPMPLLSTKSQMKWQPRKKRWKCQRRGCSFWCGKKSMSLHDHRLFSMSKAAKESFLSILRSA